MTTYEVCFTLVGKKLISVKETPLGMPTVGWQAAQSLRLRICVRRFDSSRGHTDCGPDRRTRMNTGNGHAENPELMDGWGHSHCWWDVKTRMTTGNGRVNIPDPRGGADPGGTPAVRTRPSSAG